MKTHVLPISLSVVLLLAILLSYCIAVSLDHVPALLPFISDNGVLVPERSVFSYLINFAITLQLATFYVRYEQLNCLLTHKPYSRKKRSFLAWNRICFWLGFGVSFGMSLIGNFQLESSFKNAPIQSQTQNDAEEVTRSTSAGETLDKRTLPETRNIATSIVQKIHWTGAFFTFVGGLTWMTIQSWLSLHLCICAIPKTSDVDKECPIPCKNRGVVRLVISCLGFLFLISGIVMAVIAGFQSDAGSDDLVWEDSSHSLDTWRGCVSIAAAFCEWILALLVVVYMLTFIPDFKTMEFGKLIVRASEYGGDQNLHTLQEIGNPLILPAEPNSTYKNIVRDS